MDGHAVALTPHPLPAELRDDAPGLFRAALEPAPAHEIAAALFMLLVGSSPLWALAWAWLAP